ncbi:MAG: hypothetical protein WAW86_10620 [Gammaproteobacteria bacterium]
MPTTRDEINSYLENIHGPSYRKIKKIVERMNTVAANLNLLHVTTQKLMVDIHFCLYPKFKLAPVIWDQQLESITKLLQTAQVAKAQWDIDQKFIDDFASKGDGVLKTYKDTVDIVLSKPANASPDVNNFLATIKREVSATYDVAARGFELYGNATADLSNLIREYNTALIGADKLFTSQKTSTLGSTSLSSSPENTAATSSRASSSSVSSTSSSPSSASSSRAASPSKPVAASLASSSHSQFKTGQPDQTAAQQPVNNKKPKKHGSGGCNIM